MFSDTLDFTRNETFDDYAGWELEVDQLDRLYDAAIGHIAGQTLAVTRRRLAANLLVSASARWPMIAAHIIAEAADALHQACELQDPDGQQEAAHGQISLDHVFVSSDGHVMITGMAQRGAALHKTGQVETDPGYMAPEALLPGQDVDRRADMWALGVCLWELLTGRRLFGHPDAMNASRAVIAQHIIPPSRLRSYIPAGLDRIVMRALGRDPEQRYHTVVELSRALKQWCVLAGDVVDRRDIADCMRQLHGSPEHHTDACAPREVIVEPVRDCAPREVIVEPVRDCAPTPAGRSGIRSFGLAMIVSVATAMSATLLHVAGL